jgi:hypothetical protein
VEPRAGQDDVEKRKYLTLPELELRPLSRPSLSQSLYRLRYPGCSLEILRKTLRNFVGVTAVVRTWIYTEDLSHKNQDH